jgi:hypothetical protein
MNLIKFILKTKVYNKKSQNLSVESRIHSNRVYVRIGNEYCRIFSFIEMKVVTYHVKEVTLYVKPANGRQN